MLISDRTSIQHGVAESLEPPKLFSVAHFEVDERTQKGCPMQCVGECSCRPEPCRSECFCVSHCPRHCARHR